MKLAIVIPCYNSEKMIQKVVEETIKYLEELDGYTYEFVLVNDCSKDGTYQAIKKLAEKYNFVKGLDLAKNSGQHNAILAGLRMAEGDYFVGMDDDMQTHPSQLYKLINRLEEGYDVVYGAYTHKQATGFRKLGSWFNNYTVAKLVGKPVDMKISSYWIIRKFIRDEVISYKSVFTNMQGLFLRSSNKVTNVEIEHFERLEGTSNYTLKKLIRLWSSVINYSLLPMRIPFWISAFLLVCGFIHLIAVICMHGNVAVMNHMILIVMEFIGGLLAGAIGFVGEYIGRMFMVIMNQPQSVVREYIESGEHKNENSHNGK